MADSELGLIEAAVREVCPKVGPSLDGEAPAYLCEDEKGDTIFEADTLAGAVKAIIADWDAAHQHLLDAEARLEVVERERERDEAKSDWRAAMATGMTAEAERDRLRAALEKYGRHSFSCNLGEVFRGYPDLDKVCDCGLVEALSGRDTV